MSADVTLRLRTHLERLNIQFREIRHEPTTSSDASALARREPLEIGGKAILLKTDDCFRIFVLSAARRFDSAAIRRKLQIKKVRFASETELFELTALVPGSLPPFGAPIFPLELFADGSILDRDRIAFNAGSLEVSFILGMPDYLRAAAPTAFTFSR